MVLMVVLVVLLLVLLVGGACGWCWWIWCWSGGGNSECGVVVVVAVVTRPLKHTPLYVGR